MMTDFENAVPQAKKLAQSPEGQQLARMLQELGGPDLQQAISKASQGDFSQAKQAVSALLQNPQARKLLEQLGGSYGE